MSENPSGPDCEEGRKPEDERECRALQNCNGYWFSGPWLQVCFAHTTGLVVFTNT